jgi:putative component of toxin-antitoxin plasmid stabilization module
MEVRRYLTTAGRNVLGEWLAKLADRNAKARIADRIDRLSQGNPGDCKARAEGYLSYASVGDLVIESTTR